MRYVIPTNLVCVFFGTAIPTSSFNFIQLFFILVLWMLVKDDQEGLNHLGCGYKFFPTYMLML